ncbi:MAG: glutamate racemase [Prevotellaceae bacterium]|nr:glutamate racemase [Prevotellaceae bacterium]
MIGVFDSGVGGLSVFGEIIKLLPNESITYYADSANCPYGTKSKEEIILLCSDITHRLIEAGCTIITVACNTATSAAIAHLRSNFDLPFVGIEPAVKPAALKSRTGTVGVLATEGTLKSDSFNKTRELFAGNVRVISTVGAGLVELVERGETGTPAAEKLLRKYLEPMMSEGVDNLVLGCTHYPFLSDEIRKITGEAIQQINPAPAVAQQVQRLAERHGLLSSSDDKPEYQFISSDGTCVLARMAASIVGEKAKYTVRSLR